MIEKLEQIEIKYEKILSDLEKPEVVSNQEEYRKLMKEHKTLSPIVEKFREYKKAENAVLESEEMMKEQLDGDFRAMCEEEYKQGKLDMQRCTEELKILLLPRDPDDDKNVIVEIRAGAGGEEAALFAGVLYRMYSMYAESAGFKTETISSNETGLGGFREISFMVEGEGAFSKLKFESGVHRVQRVPETETSGRIHTSTVTVAVLPEAEEVEIDINPADLKIESCKSSGAGGQHVNKTESAVRLTHIPTGIVIECQEERSQFKNRDKAMKLLRTKLFDMKQSEQNEKIASARKSMVGTGDRSEKIRTYQ
jgi:peptide chain release factor 1